MTEFITNFLKNLGCSHCQEYEFQENSSDSNSKTNMWKLYLKEYEMFSSMILYNDVLKKNISSIIKKNEAILLLDDRKEVYIRLEYISDNEEDNMPILVPTDDYQELYEKIEMMEKPLDKEMNAYYIGTFSIKKAKL